MGLSVSLIVLSTFMRMKVMLSIARNILRRRGSIDKGSLPYLDMIKVGTTSRVIKGGTTLEVALDARGGLPFET